MTDWIICVILLLVSVKGHVTAYLTTVLRKYIVIEMGVSFYDYSRLIKQIIP